MKIIAQRDGCIMVDGKLGDLPSVQPAKKERGMMSSIQLVDDAYVPGPAKNATDQTNGQKRSGNKKQQKGKKTPAVEESNPNLLVRMKGTLYVYDHIKIVSAHAPMIDLTIAEATAAKVTENPIESEIIDNAVPRVHKDSRGTIYILSGKNTIMEMIEKGQTIIKARLVSKQAMWRTEAPTATVVEDKLKKALLAGNTNARITLPNDKKKPALLQTASNQPSEKKAKGSEQYGQIFSK
jgi:hypothetical protein